MVEYKITIDINQTVSNDSSVVGNSEAASSAVKMSTKTSVGMAAALGAGKRLLQYGLSSIEAFTGNSSLQTQVDNTMKVASYGMGLITNPIATIATMGVNAVTQAITRKNEIMWGNKQAERLQRRGGLYLSANQR